MNVQINLLLSYSSVSIDRLACTFRVLVGILIVSLILFIAFFLKDVMNHGGLSMGP